MDWQKLFEASGVPGVWLPWLANADSMTKALEEVSGIPCQVSVQHEGWQKPWDDEQHCLPLPLTPCWVREVILITRQPVLFARAVFPKPVIDCFPEIISLGSQALANIIFSDNNFQRGTIEVAEISVDDRLWQQMPEKIRVETHWARRSLFHSMAPSFLLSEVFFPYVATL